MAEATKPTTVTVSVGPAGTGEGASGPIQVLNVGTAEDPNYFGSAYEMGRFHGVRMALEAVKNVGPWDDSYDYERGRNQGRDDCEEAVEALLPKG